MIFGSVKIDAQAVHTHRDSYVLSSLSVVSVRRPLLSAAALMGMGFASFAVAFEDLLYAHEIKMIFSCVAVALLGGVSIGQLKLLSRDLRGSELAGVIWGSYGRLNRVRTEIVDAIRSTALDVRS